MSRKGVSAAVLTAALGLGAFGCSGGGQGHGGAGAEPAAGEADGRSSFVAGRDATGAEDRGRASANRATVQTRAVIRTGKVSLVARDLAAARAEVDRLLARHGGYIAEEETSNDAKGRPSSSRLVLRLPAPAFDATMSDLAEIGRLQMSRREAEDVTTELIDVNTRVSAQEVSLQRLERFLRQATSVEDMIRVESEIAERQAELESLKAQQEYLDDQTSLSTITLHLSTPQTFVEPPGRLDDAGFVSGLKSGWNALQIFLVAVLTILGAALPFSVIVALVGIPVWLLVRAASHRRTAPAEEDEPPVTS